MNSEQNIPSAETQFSPKTGSSTVDSVFAWLSLVFAFLFCQVTPVAKHPMGGLLFIAALFVTAFIVLGCKKIKLHPSCVLSSISALLISATLILTESGFLVWLAYTYCLGSYFFLIYAAFGNRVEQGFSDYIYIDYIKILFILPYCSIISIFSALANKSTRKLSLFLLKILIGLILTVIPTALIFAFLSYDEGFMKILDDIFSFNPETIPQILYGLIFFVPYAMYSFGLYASSQKGILKDKITAQNCNSILQKVKVLPQITAVVAAAPIVFLYVVFFISQWKYYVSGFTGVLPESFSYAEYARQGFFELCAVSVINLIIIAITAAFIRRGSKNRAVVLKILTVVFCLFTLILISTAVAKLVMYIDYYGLTQKRIYAMWLMALIAIVFVVIALGQFIPKIPIIAVSCSVFIVMFAALSLCNVNAITARYNTDRYLSGTLETIDTEAMEDLGDSAIPSLVKIAKGLDVEKDRKLKTDIDIILYEKAEEIREEKFSVFTFNLPAALAKSALKDYVPAIPPAGSYTVTSMSVDDVPELYDENNPDILMIRDDRTGTFSHDGQTYDVTVTQDRIVIGEQAFTFRYKLSYSRKNVTLSLYSSDEAEQAVTIILKPAS